MVFGTITADDVNRSDQCHDFASGKATNAARVLHSLGRPATLVTVAGGDRGPLFLADLNRAGIAVRAVQVTTPTRLCVTVIDQGRRHSTELVEEPRPLDADVADALAAELEAALQGARMLVLSGKLAPGLPDNFLARAVQAANERGVRSVLDTRKEPLHEALEARPFIVKPNRSELAETVGRSVDSRSAMHDAMAMLVDRGAQHVVCTRGRDGSSLCGRDEAGDIRFWNVSTPSVESVSPIGCGDAFAAGLAAGLRDGASVVEACRFASACGAANALTPHAGHLDAPTAQALLEQVKVRQID